jgi:hypothetical protein
VGSFKNIKTTKPKRNPGKVDALLNEKLQKVEWGDFKIGDLFEINTYKKRFDANKVKIFDSGDFPYVVRTGLNNGIKGYINEDEQFLNEGNTISFGQDTATMFYQEKPYFTGDKIKIVKSKDKRFNKNNAQFFILSMNKSFSSFTWGSSSYSVQIIQNQKIQLPTKKGKIDYEFMESFIAELEAQRIAELEAFLLASGLKNYNLTNEEQKVLEDFENFEWKTFNLQSLFGKSTRGQRLKSTDRISGNLPFVTAGEFNDGISAFIGNDVHIFSENTTTIDMFGSAKYRNYKYGGDDHVAIVHTENLQKLASIFVTSSIHKTSSAGQFSYSRNFYAKDADELNISLPEINNRPNYVLMETFITAIQKLVIKEVVLYADRKIEATQTVTQN